MKDDFLKELISVYDNGVNVIPILILNVTSEMYILYYYKNKILSRIPISTAEHTIKDIFERHNIKDLELCISSEIIPQRKTVLYRNTELEVILYASDGNRFLFYKWMDGCLDYTTQRMHFHNNTASNISGIIKIDYTDDNLNIIEELK